MHLQATSCSSLVYFKQTLILYTSCSYILIDLFYSQYNHAAHGEVRFTFPMTNTGNIGITVLFLFFKFLVNQLCGAHFVQGEKQMWIDLFCVHIFGSADT